MTLSLSLESSVRLHFHRLRTKLGEKERVILCNSEGDWTNIEKVDNGECSECFNAHDEHSTYQARNQRTVFVSSIFPFHADQKYLCFDNNNL